MRNRSQRRRGGVIRFALVAAVVLALVGLGPVALAANDGGTTAAVTTQPVAKPKPAGPYRIRLNPVRRRSIILGCTP